MVEVAQRRVAAIHVCGRDPGFTLVELLVTIAIAAILLTLAAPSYTDLILTQEVRTSAQNLQTTLIFARSEAIKRASDVQVIPSGSDWKNGWTVRLADGTVLRSQSALNAQLASIAGATITYGSDGHIPPPTPGVITFRVSGNPRVTTRCLRTDLSGRTSAVVADGTSSNACS